MAEKILTAKDIPSKIKKDYIDKILKLREQGQVNDLPDLEYKGNYFFLDNKGGGKWSPKNRAQKYNTDAARRAAINDHSISKEEYRDFARRNGYTQQQADMLFDRKETDLKQLQRTKGPLAYEHFTPTTSKAYGGVEHPRNLGHLDPSLNAAKSDKLMSSTDARNLGIPLNKQSAIRMDFAGLPVADKTEQMGRVLEAVDKPGVVKARTKNTRVARAMKARVLHKLGRTVNLPLIGGTVAAGTALLGGAGPGEAATAFVDAENPLDGGAVADGSLQGAAIAEQKQRDMKPLKDIAANEAKYVGNKLLNEMRYIKNSVMGLRLPYMPF